MKIFPSKIEYTKIPKPVIEGTIVPVDITDRTIAWRKGRVLHRIKELGLNTLIIYGDREHGANFGYLCGFEPRFEESVIVLHKSGEAYMLLGNEALKMAQHSRLEVQSIHVPHFSLPNQPMDNERSLTEVMRAAQVKPGDKVGIAGWKMFTGNLEDNRKLFDVPHFIVQAVMQVAGEENVINACDVFIHPDKGVRIIANANEIAHYEFGATLASNCVLTLLDAIEVGKTEMELAKHLAALGQPTTVQPICATGHRFTNAVVAPRNKKVRLGDIFTTTMGLRGGLTNRAGYIAKAKEDLSSEVSDYIDQVVKPYFAAAATWYATIGIGVTGGEIYESVNTVAPKEKYGWKLNPGHYTSSEEWMSSPIYKDSPIYVRSGMMFQMDIIMSVPGYGGVNGEDGIAIADEELRSQIKIEYPQTWERICQRRRYMMDVLGIPLREEVLPLSNIAGYVRPLLLAKDKAMKVQSL